MLRAPRLECQAWGGLPSALGSPTSDTHKDGAHPLHFPEKVKGKQK